MLKVTGAELAKLQVMLTWLQNHQDEFAEVLVIPTETGVPRSDIDNFGTVLLDLIAEQFGLEHAKGSLNTWNAVHKETIQECVDGGEFLSIVILEHLNNKVYELLDLTHR